MYEVMFDERHKLGLERLTGGNRGIVYANERKVMVDIPAEEDGGEAVQVEKWAYDAYEVDDARSSSLAKNSVIGEEHPAGDEQKILRKTLAKVLRKLGEYDTEDNAEFKQYDQFAEALEVGHITGSVVADEPTEEELLAKAKTEKVSQIDSYNSSANVNAFTVNGIPMWLDFDLRARLKNSIDAAEANGKETLTKVYGGHTFTYPILAWRQMFTVVEDYAGDCQNISEQHKADVEAMTTLEEVEAFDITVGYPPHPAF